MTINARSATMLLVVVAAACATGRRISAQRLVDPSLMKASAKDLDPEHRPWEKAKQKPMPTFSSNDRARWATVRAKNSGATPRFSTHRYR